MTQPQDWPFDQPAEGTLRPWYLTATGYLEVLFSDPEEAQRAQRGLLQHQIPQEELRLYASEEILRILSQLQEERSIVAKAVAALVADPDAKRRFLDNAWTGGAALWLVARTRDRADHLVQPAPPHAVLGQQRGRLGHPLLQPLTAQGVVGPVGVADQRVHQLLPRLAVLPVTGRLARRGVVILALQARSHLRLQRRRTSPQQPPDRAPDHRDRVLGGHRVLQRGRVQHPLDPDQPRLAGQRAGHPEDPVRIGRAAQPGPQRAGHHQPVEGDHAAGVGREPGQRRPRVRPGEDPPAVGVEQGRRLQVGPDPDQALLPGGGRVGEPPSRRAQHGQRGGPSGRGHDAQA